MGYRRPSLHRFRSHVRSVPCVFEGFRKHLCDALNGPDESPKSPLTDVPNEHSPAAVASGVSANSKINGTDQSIGYHRWTSST